MKHLKIFEEFKVGTLYTGTEDSNTTQIEIDGYPVKIINQESSLAGDKFVYIIIDVWKGEALQFQLQCFSELDDAKNHISNMIKRYQNPSDGGESIEIDSFIIVKQMLDNGPVMKYKGDGPNNKKTVSDDGGEPINSNKIYDHIEKNINVLVDAYVAITTQRYKETFTKDLIRKGLVRLQQECKFNDLSRTKEAIKVFNDLMTPMMEDVHKSKNIETWKLGSNGKKYYSVFRDFRNMSRLI